MKYVRFALFTIVIVGGVSAVIIFIRNEYFDGVVVPGIIVWPITIAAIIAIVRVFHATIGRIPNKNK